MYLSFIPTPVLWEEIALFNSLNITLEMQMNLHGFQENREYFLV